MSYDATISDWVERCHQNALNKGWWSRLDDTIAVKLLMLHSEISEAVEELRSVDRKEGTGDVDYEAIRYSTRDSDGKPIGFASELADIVIRAFDIAGRAYIDLEDELQKKMLYNMQREARHGNKNY